MVSKFSTLVLLSLLLLAKSDVIWQEVAADASSSTTDASTTSESSTSAPCEDDPNTNCDQFKSLCSNEKYIPLLKQFCPVTCNFCPGATTVPVTSAPNCSDMSSNCVNWVKNGFCTNSFYKCADRIKYCQKSCGYCNPATCKD